MPLELVAEAEVEGEGMESEIGARTRNRVAKPKHNAATKEAEVDSVARKGNRGRSERQCTNYLLRVLESKNLGVIPEAYCSKAINMTKKERRGRTIALLKPQLRRVAHQPGGPPA
ncbi:hypothetical protein S83_052128 [Arachis hypogaea]